MIYLYGVIRKDKKSKIIEKNKIKVNLEHFSPRLLHLLPIVLRFYLLALLLSRLF